MRLGVGRALVAGVWVDGDVEIDEGVVVAVGCAGGASGRVAAPGFVDRQVNGFAGVDLRTSDADSYATVAGALARHGVTAFCPTFYSCEVERYLDALAVLGGVHREPPPGARVLGAHLEGPFLSPRWAGAHDPARLRPPDVELARRLLDAGPVAVMTLAPELEGANEVVDELVSRGVVVSMGHTDATAAVADRAIDRGVSMITHCHNAHRRFGARDPGPAGVALVRPEVVVGLICDLVHLAPETVQGVFAAAGDRVAVVTDAVAPAGTTARSWSADGATVTVEEGRASLGDGTLAGSVITPDGSLQALVGIGIDPRVALVAMSTTPARDLDLGPHDLSPGSPADLVVLDGDWAVRATYVGGVSVS
jgi:N-acetylglucosamine-6-phosphate deacetylase